jgi:hypothetical protein
MKTPMMDGESRAVGEYQEIIDAIGPYSILSGTKDIKPLGASQMIAAAKEAVKRDGESEGRVWLCAVSYSPMLGPDGKPYGSMGRFWVPANEVLKYWRRGHEMQMLQALRQHYGHLGNVYVLSYKTAMKLGEELKNSGTRINI